MTNDSELPKGSREGVFQGCVVCRRRTGSFRTAKGALVCATCIVPASDPAPIPGDPRHEPKPDQPAWLSLPVTVRDGGPFETAFAGSDDDATRFCVCPDRPVHGQADEGEAPLRCGNCGKAIAGSVAPTEAERLLLDLIGVTGIDSVDACDRTIEYLLRRGLIQEKP